MYEIGHNYLNHDNNYGCYLLEKSFESAISLYILNVLFHLTTP